MILDLMLAIKNIHDENYFLCDFKLENISFDLDENNFKLLIIDSKAFM